MRRQALRISAGSDPQAEEPGKCKGPGVEVCRGSLRKSSRLEELKHCEWWMVDVDSWEEVTEVAWGQITHYPSGFYPVRHGNSMESFEQRSETI